MTKYLSLRGTLLLFLIFSFHVNAMEEDDITRDKKIVDLPHVDK